MNPNETDSSTSSSVPAAKFRRCQLIPKGFTRNPLLTLERNRKCPCQSGLKFKRCCLNRISRIVPEMQAKVIKEQMAMPDFVFVMKPADKSTGS